MLSVSSVSVVLSDSLTLSLLSFPKMKYFGLAERNFCAYRGIVYVLILLYNIGITTENVTRDILMGSF